MPDPEVVYQLVTGEWTHVDGDRIARPDGVARFVPVPDSLPPLAAVTVGTVRCLISGGVLEDIQGRAGVQLAARIDGAPVRWRMTVERLSSDGRPVPSKDVEFDPDPAGVRVTAL